MPFRFTSFLLCAEINLLSRFFLVSYLIILHELLLPWQSHPSAGVICTYFPFLGKHHYTMVENGKKHERGSERIERASEQVSAAEGASEASSPEQADE